MRFTPPTERKIFNIVDVSFFRQHTGWFVAETDDGTKVVGTAILPPWGRVDADCYFERNNWGEQWHVVKIRYEEIGDIIQSLLSSGFLVHVREAKAKNITETLGIQFFSVLEAACVPELYKWDGQMKNPADVLCLVNGIGPFIAGQLIEAWKEKRLYFRAAIDAIRCELSPAQFRWATSREGYETFSKIVHSDEPYIIYDLLRFLSWEDVDRIALEEWEDKPAIPWDSPIRMSGATKHALHQIASNHGHMCAPESNVLAHCLENLGIENPLDLIDDLEKYGLHEEDGFLSLKQAHDIERHTAERLAYLANFDSGSIHVADEDIAVFSNGLTLVDAQVEAVKLALENPISVITGGPGTGKTTILKTITNILEAKKQEITLCAPTGNAARRMTSATGIRGWTLHLFFKLFMSEKEREVLEKGWLFIDEMSMTSADILEQVLNQVMGGVHVVFIGDADQLPPVGPGEPLLQIIESGFPTVRLTEIHRQGKNSPIIEACHRINAGEMPEEDTLLPNGSKKDPKDRTVVIRSMRRNQLKESCLSAITWLMEAKEAKDDDIQILTPINNDSKNCGIGQEEMNLTIRNIFNPDHAKHPTPVKGISLFDRVLQRKNNYRIGGEGVMNGQVGKVIDLTDDGTLIVTLEANKEDIDWVNNGLTQMPMFVVEFEEEQIASYTMGDAQDLSLAYAMTIHKSQGAQFKHVILIVPEVWGLRYRQLIYTGSSRPSETSIILEENYAMKKYIENEEKLRRYSMLGKFIKQEMEVYGAK